MRKRSSLNVMIDLLVLAKEHLFLLLIAIIAGIVSFLSSTGIAVLAALLIVHLAGFLGLPFTTMVYIMVLLALLRGLSRYLEQYLNHLVAFKVLSTLRDKVFAKLRNLAPAKVESKNKGALISLITSDIELIEVFYAHTISPIIIAITTAIIYLVVIAIFSPIIALITLISYLFMGIVLPIVFSKWAKKTGRAIRREIGSLNNIFLDLLRGITEIMQFAYHDKAIRVVQKTNLSLVNKQAALIKQLALLLATEDFVAVLTAGIVVFVGYITGLSWAIILPLMFGVFFSFPAIANVASLGNGLSQSLASGERLLNLLEEKPIIEELSTGVDLNLENSLVNPLIKINGLSFSYDNQIVLNDFSLNVFKGEILGIRGESGCGKSTLMKLIMRFWPVNTGEIRIAGHSVEDINTQSLWSNISYMTQSTEFFEGSIRDNLLIAKPDATDAELNDALQKASVLTFVERLEHGLDTPLTELGDNFSAGERQRFGLARCFLEDTKILLLDEPTSNLDVLNENIILDALKRNQADKTILMISHRESSFRICNRVIQM